MTLQSVADRCEMIRSTIADTTTATMTQHIPLPPRPQPPLPLIYRVLVAPEYTKYRAPRPIEMPVHLSRRLDSYHHRVGNGV